MCCAERPKLCAQGAPGSVQAFTAHGKQQEKAASDSKKHFLSDLPCLYTNIRVQYISIGKRDREGGFAESSVELQYEHLCC